MKNALRTFVGALAQTGTTDQIVRWKDEICPTIIGIDPAEVDFMAQRIAEVGKPLHLRWSRTSCVAPMIIIVTPDAAEFANWFVREFQTMFRVEGVGKLHRFASSTRPVRWISLTNECGEGCGTPNSRIVKGTTPIFQAIVVVVDANKIGGYSLGELSDYVTMVALSNPKSSANERDDSILSMFDRPRAAGTLFQLTDVDHAFLAGLYGTQLDASAQSQRAAIANRMKRELGKKSEDPRSR